MTLLAQRRLLSADSAADGELKAALKADGAMRADSSRSSDSTAGDAGDGGGLAANGGGAAMPASRSRQTGYQHSASDEDPTVLMCGCFGPTGMRPLLLRLVSLAMLSWATLIFMGICWGPCMPERQSIASANAAKHAASLQTANAAGGTTMSCMPHVPIRDGSARQADAISLLSQAGPQLARHAAVSVAAADVAIRPGFLWRSPDAASPSHHAAEPDQPQPRQTDGDMQGDRSPSGCASPRGASIDDQQRQAAEAAAALTADCQDVACVIGHFGGAPGSTFAGKPPRAERQHS